MQATYHYQLTPDRYRSALAVGTRLLLAEAAMRKTARRVRWGSVLAWFVLALGGQLWLQALETGSAVGVLVLILLVALFLPLVTTRLIQVAALNRVAASAFEVTGPVCLEVDDAGLALFHDRGSSRILWQGLRGVEEAPGLVVILLHNFSVLPVPDAAFADAAQRQAFLAHLRDHLPADTVPAPGPGLSNPGQGQPGARRRPGLVRGVGAHLARGGRLLFLRSPGRTPPVTWTYLILLGLLSLAVPPLDALFHHGLNGEFALYALPEALFHLPVFILAAWALATLAGRVARSLDLVLALLAMAVCLDGVMALTHGLGGALWPGWEDWSTQVYWLFQIWLTLAAMVAGVRLLGLSPGRRLAAGAVTVLALALPLGLMYRDRVLWQPTESAAERAENERRWNALASEDSFYRQPRLLDERLAALQPGRPGVTELFYVGFAGDAGQDVFMKEVRAVEALFRERFGTSDHGISLINNPDSVADSPIASVTSLERSLRRVAELMNGEEDILFLYLSSHGGEDHRLALDFWPLRFKTLDPARLRALLDAAGIRRRVVVVSACYSGGFIEALKDDHTLVITAAAPDRQSFGCDNTADFTYFGQAYFDEALRQTHSFTRAFDLARARIGQRERQEGRRPSDPRLYLGESLRQPLEDFARARARESDQRARGDGSMEPVEG